MAQTPKTENSVPTKATAAGRILILGLGISGHAAAELAIRRGYDVTVLDSAHGPTLDERAETLRERGAEVMLDWLPAHTPPTAQLAVISPGIPPTSPLGTLAATLPCPVISEMEWGYRHCQCPLLAVTGTNGKTTTVEMTVHCLQQAGFKTLAAGNIGVPLSHACRRSAGIDCLVLEVSSYQLERVETFSPLAVALLNLSPDHMDRYRCFEDYARTKFRLLDCGKGARLFVLRADVANESDARTRLPDDRHRLLTFSSDRQNTDLFADENGALHRRTGWTSTELLPPGALRVAGHHNLENALAAVALCSALGVQPEQSARSLSSYVPSPHRMERFATADGVTYVNDSKSTNPDSLACALEALASPGAPRILLIAGGLAKKLQFDFLQGSLERFVREAFLIGEAAEELSKAWASSTPCRTFRTLEAAVDSAIDASEPGDVVLLSPGCASQDMFANYAERGTVFCNSARRRLSI